MRLEMIDDNKGWFLLVTEQAGHDARKALENKSKGKK